MASNMAAIHFYGGLCLCIGIAASSIITALDGDFVTDTSNNDQVDNGDVQAEDRKLEHLETNKKLGDLLARMEQLEAREKSREKAYLHEIQNLRRQLLVHTRRTASLEGLVKRLFNKRPEHLNQTMDKTDTEKSSNDRSGRIKLAKIKSPEVVKPNRIRRAEYENPVAFFATLSGQHLTHVGAHQPITFNNVVTNIGSAYNSHFGSLFAPVSGTYVFSVTLFSVSRSNYHAQFVKNGQRITWMYVTGLNSGQDTTSQTIILQLQKGDEVGVQNADSDKPIHGYDYSTFAGFLLHEDISSSVIVGK